MGPKRVTWVRRYQGQCRALRPLGHQGYRLRIHNKDQPLCSGYTVHAYVHVQALKTLICFTVPLTHAACVRECRTVATQKVQ